MILPSVYVIVDHPGWLERLLPCGVRWVQLRMKGSDPQELRRLVRSALISCQEFGAQLVVNDDWECAIETGCEWVHLGQEDLDGADLPALRAAGVKLGISTHTEEELERALSMSPSYVALGPIFETILKPMRYPPQGFERLTLWRQRVGSLPLVAIGGMTPERAKEALKRGASSVAVVTDILRHQAPEERMKEWLETVTLG